MLLGVFFRFYHIERKVYWEDETYTSLHVLGVTEADVVRRSAQIIDASALRAVLHPAGPLTTTVGETIHSLAVEDPQHPPLYYIAGHLWVKLFGDSVASIRTLSAIAGVVALPFMYWLGIELFGSRLAAWLGAALYAVSPIAVLYSQEAREYIFWSLAVIVMSATFLRALRLMSARAWALYALALGASLYVYPVSGVFAASNILVAWRAKRTGLRTLVSPAVATLAGCAAFLPWVAILYSNFHTVDRAMGLTDERYGSKLAVIPHFAGLLDHNFLDFNLAGRNAFAILTSFAALVLIGYAFYRLVRTAPTVTWLFIVTTTIFAAAPFLLLDLFRANTFTTQPRYFMPVYLGIDLALAYLFASTLKPGRFGSAQRRAWTLVFAGVLVARAASCGVSANADTWWSKWGERSIEVARAINQSDHPLLLSDEFVERPLSLSNYLDPKVALQLRPRCYLCQIDASAKFDLDALKRHSAYSDVFVLGPSSAIAHEVKAAIQPAGDRERYRCIGDLLDNRSKCAAGTLHLWPGDFR